MADQEDLIDVEIGTPLDPALTLIDVEIVEDVGLKDVPPAVSVEGLSEDGTAAIDAYGITETVIVELFDDTVDVQYAPSGSPTGRQLLGLDAMDSGWAARTQHPINGTPASPTTQLTPVTRQRGVMAADETVDLRGVTVWQHAQNKSGLELNDNGTVADTSCSVRPAVVGSISTTPKAQVGRVWGLHAGTSGHTAVPESGPWQQWKGLGQWKGTAVDGVSDPWDGRPYIVCKPGALSDRKNWCFVDGIWFRHVQDGISTRGSAMEVRNCLCQWTHDDGHWLGGSQVPPPIHLYKNLYWNLHMGISYLTEPATPTPPAAGGDVATVEGCVYGFTRNNGYHNSVDDINAQYDDHGHGSHMKWRGATHRPKLKYIDTHILMLGRPLQSSLSQLCVPVGSTATRSTFTYVDMGHQTGDKPPNYPPNASQWWQAGSMSLSDAGFDVHVVSGTNLSGACTQPGHSDHPVQDLFWPAVQKWTDEHPQYGLASMTADPQVNNNILNGT